MLRNFMTASRVELILNTPGEDVRMSQALESAEKQLPKLFRERPGAEATARFAIGLAWVKLGRPEDAVRYLARAVELWEVDSGSEDQDVCEALTCLGKALVAAGRPQEAVPHFEKVCNVVEGQYGERHRREKGDYTSADLKAEYNLALALKAAGKLPDAIRHLERVHTRQLDNTRPDRPKYQAREAFSPDVIIELAAAYRAGGRPDDARRLWADAGAKVPGRLGPVNPSTIGLQISWINDLIDDGQTAKAVEVGRVLVATFRADSPVNSSNLAYGLELLGRALLADRQPREAEPVLRECLAIRTKEEPDAWGTFDTRSMLGAALLGQKKYGDAEPLLVSGYEGMKQREALMSSGDKIRLREAADRLIELSTATNKPDEVAKWRAERAKYNLEVFPLPRRGD
jgi:tetratricopeptide (TPR) repeat protein